MNYQPPRIPVSVVLLLFAFAGSTPVFAQGISEFGALNAIPKVVPKSDQQTNSMNSLYGSAGKATAGVDAAINAALGGGSPKAGSKSSPARSGSTRLPGGAIKSGDLPGQAASAARAQMIEYSKQASETYKKGMEALAKGKINEAEPLLRKSLVIRETYWKDKDKLSPQIMVKLADIYMTKGEYKKAESVLNQQLAALSRIYGPGSEHRLQPLTKLAEAYKHQGDKLHSYEASKQAYYLACRSKDANVKPAPLLLSTGKLAIELSKYREAEQIYEEALAEDQRGKLTQEELLIAIEDYSTALKKMNRDRDAEFVLLQAQQIREGSQSASSAPATPEKPAEPAADAATAK